MAYLERGRISNERRYYKIGYHEILRSGKRLVHMQHPGKPWPAFATASRSRHLHEWVREKENRMKRLSKRLAYYSCRSVDSMPMANPVVANLRC